MGQHNRSLGAWGEDRAARWYRDAGYDIVDRNWRDGRRGELDLIARRGDTLVFCEVKTRSSARFGAPIEAITPDKARRIRVLAHSWMSSRRRLRPRHLRFDVVSVVGPHIEVHEGVF